MSRTHAQIVAELQDRWPEHRVAPSQARVRALCDLLGSPERSLPVILIAGTNGKGSTALMIDSLLRALGLRVGRYASPHLVDVTERISIDGEPISAEAFDALVEEVSPLVELVDAQLLEGVRMTFFEVMTALAYAAFADAPVDVAVVEVGLGGRWDATNIVEAEVAVVCPVDLDHTHLLGGTVAEIAAEKAGIIKAGAKAVLAAQQPDAARVLLARCAVAGGRGRGCCARVSMVTGPLSLRRTLASGTPCLSVTVARRTWAVYSSSSRWATAWDVSPVVMCGSRTEARVCVSSRAWWRSMLSTNSACSRPT